MYAVTRGRMATAPLPIANSPGSFLADWRASRLIRNSKYYSGAGFGYGADMNGLHSESGPTTVGGSNGIAASLGTPNFLMSGQ